MSTVSTMNNKLEVKDLINVGVFTAIYFICFYVTGMVGYFPIFMPLIPFLCPIVAGIPFMLYMTKVKKFGMILITGIICGLLFVASGHQFYPLITAIIFSLFAELMVKKSNYKSVSMTRWAYSVFSMWLMGMLIPMYISRETYFKDIADTYGQDYVDALGNYMPMWSLPIFLILSFIGGFIGATIGIKILNKHFKKAGMA